MLQRWRYSLEEQQRAFSGENWICAANLSDLRRGLLHALNRRLRAPAESVAPEAGGEFPAVFLRLGHYAGCLACSDLLITERGRKGQTQ
jgi:hypothetical protein